MEPMKEKELRILNASLDLFVERGFHGTSTSEIAKSAGVATGTLFHYFKTKEELINRLYLYSKECMLQEINDDYHSENSFKDNINALWTALVDFGINNSAMFQFILSFHCSPYITSLTKKEVETRSERIMEAYILGLEKQKIKDVPYDLIVDYLWGSVVTTVNYFEKHPQKMNPQIRDLAFDLFWDGISR